MKKNEEQTNDQKIADSVILIKELKETVQNNEILHKAAIEELTETGLSLIEDQKKSSKITNKQLEENEILLQERCDLIVSLQKKLEAIDLNELKIILEEKLLNNVKNLNLELLNIKKRISFYRKSIVLNEFDSLAFLNEFPEVVN